MWLHNAVVQLRASSKERAKRAISRSLDCSNATLGRPPRRRLLQLSSSESTRRRAVATSPTIAAAAASSPELLRRCHGARARLGGHEKRCVAPHDPGSGVPDPGHRGSLYRVSAEYPEEWTGTGCASGAFNPPVESGWAHFVPSVFARRWDPRVADGLSAVTIRYALVRRCLRGAGRRSTEMRSARNTFSSDWYGTSR